jgi:hypothetical protein
LAMARIYRIRRAAAIYRWMILVRGRLIVHEGVVVTDVTVRRYSLDALRTIWCRGTSPLAMRSVSPIASTSLGAIVLTSHTSNAANAALQPAVSFDRDMDTGIPVNVIQAARWLLPSW